MMAVKFMVMMIMMMMMKYGNTLDLFSEMMYNYY